MPFKITSDVSSSLDKCFMIRIFHIFHGNIIHDNSCSNYLTTLVITHFTYKVSILSWSPMTIFHMVIHHSNLVAKWHLDCQKYSVLAENAIDQLIDYDEQILLIVIILLVLLSIVYVNN